MDLRPHIEKFRRRFTEIEAALSNPNAFDNQQRAQEMSKEYARLKELVACGDVFFKTQEQLAENRALLQNEAPESELGQMAREEVTRLEAEEKRFAQQIQFGLVPPNLTDSRNTIDEIEINVCRASGKGGQGVNTTDSAVQIIHKPTGMIVRCADQRSQQKNKLQAMNVLRARLLERKIAEEDAKYAAHRKDQVGTGERSEKIRTYNFPQNRITDHRIELTLYNLANVIDGDLDPLIEPLMTHDLEEKLAALKL